MSIPTEAEISSFLECIKKKVCEQGGKPEDVAHFFKACEHTYYEQVTDLIAKNAVWLTPKMKPKGKSFEVEVSYNPDSLPEKVDSGHGQTIFCKKPKYLSGDKTEVSCTRIEHMRFLPTMKTDRHSKDVRERAEKSGLKSGNILHAFAIKERAEKDPDFKKTILPFLPIYFLGARYHSQRIIDNKEIYRQTVYIGLDLNFSDRYHGGREEPRMENPPIVWRYQSARVSFCKCHCAFY